MKLFFTWLGRTIFKTLIENKYGLRMKKIQFEPISRDELDQEHSQIDIEISSSATNPQDFRLKLQQKIDIYKNKELTNLSDVAYQSFINVGVNFPSLRFNKNLRAVLNKEFVFHSNNLGEYCVPTEKISYYFRIHKDKIKLQNNTMHIRLAGDGVNICKNFQVLNFTFAFLNSIAGEDSLDANTALGNFILRKLHIKSESYTELKEALRELSELLSALKEINVDGTIYKIEWWLGGDLKFLLLVLGLNAANSYYCCAWCVLHKEELSIDICRHKINRKLNADEPGQIHEPIFPFIRIENVIPDPLHLFLRIADKLINNLKPYLEQLDQTFSVELERHTNLNRYVQFLEKEKIKKGCYLDGTQLKLRSLDGVQKKKLFQNINLALLFHLALLYIGISGSSG